MPLAPRSSLIVACVVVSCDVGSVDAEPVLPFHPFGVMHPIEVP